MRDDFFQGELGALLGDKQEFSGAYRNLIADAITEYLSRSNQFFVNVQKEKAEKGELSKKLNDANSKLSSYKDLVSKINDEKKEAKDKVYALESKINKLQEELNEYKGTSDLPTPPSITGEKDEVVMLKSAEDRLAERILKLNENLKDSERRNQDLQSKIEKCKNLISERDLNIEYIRQIGGKDVKKINDLKLELEASKDDTNRAREKYGQIFNDLKLELEASEDVTNRACEKYRQMFTKNYRLENKTAQLDKQVSELNEEKKYLVGLIKCFAQQGYKQTSNFDNKFNHDSSVSKIKQRSYSSSK